MAETVEKRSRVNTLFYNQFHLKIKGELKTIVNGGTKNE